jgi:hypothetical protein
MPNTRVPSAAEAEPELACDQQGRDRGAGGKRARPAPVRLLQESSK